MYVKDAYYIPFCSRYSGWPEAKNQGNLLIYHPANWLSTERCTSSPRSCSSPLKWTCLQLVFQVWEFFHVSTCISILQQSNSLHQWPFQDPKLEVPTLHKAYIRVRAFNFFGFLWYSTASGPEVAVDWQSTALIRCQETRRKRIRAICWYGMAMGISNLWIILAGGRKLRSAKSASNMVHCYPHDVLNRCFGFFFTNVIPKNQLKKSNMLIFYWFFLLKIQQSSRESQSRPWGFQKSHQLQESQDADHLAEEDQM